MIVCQKKLRSEPANSLPFFQKILVIHPYALRRSKGIQPCGRAASQRAIVLHFRSWEKYIFSEGLELMRFSELHDKKVH
jgi:hypothetical protein